MSEIEPFTYFEIPMSTVGDSESDFVTDVVSTSEDLPDYAFELATYHRAHGSELRSIVGDLPLKPGDRVLDFACGDGTHSRWLAERVGDAGFVVGLDSSVNYLELAQSQIEWDHRRCVVAGTLEALPLATEKFDLVWCAQSLISLPDSVAAVRKMATAVRSGGYVAVLENDAIHQLILPWPARLELAIRKAELVHHEQSARQPEKRYIGRRLAATLRKAGLVEVYRKTYVAERIAPLDADEQQFLTQHLARLREITMPHLTRADRRKLDALTDPHSPQCMLQQPDFEMAWLDIVCCGRKPGSRRALI